MNGSEGCDCNAYLFSSTLYNVNPPLLQLMVEGLREVTFNKRPRNEI